MTLSVLQKTPVLIHDPYPHVIIEDALPEDIYNQLDKEWPTQQLLATAPFDNGICYRLKSDQMLRNNAVGGVEFYSLVNFVFERTLKLGSPARDKQVKEKRDEIYDCMKNGGLFCQLVPLFIKNANTCIDWIHEDLGNVKKNLSKLSKK